MSNRTRPDGLSELGTCRMPDFPRRNAACESDMIDRLVEARALADELDLGIVGKLIDATLLEVGYQLAARARSQ